MRWRTVPVTVLRMAVCFITTLSLAVGEAADLRTWTDATGKFSVKARFAGLTDGKVTLELEGGKQVEIPLDKLSRTDQTYISSLPAENPFAPKEDNPFAPKSNAGGAGPATMPGKGVVDDSGAFESRLVKPKTRSVRTLNLFNNGDGWQVDVASLGPAPGADHAGHPFQLPAKKEFHEKFSGLHFNGGMTHALIGYNQDFPNRDQPRTRLLLVDLKSGNVAEHATGGKLAPLALADDGQTVLMRRDEFGFGKSDRLELWTLGARGIEKGPAWYAYDAASGGDRDVRWAAFAPQGKLLTLSAAGLLACWSLDPLEAEWICNVAGDSRPVLSPNRKFLLLSDKSQICLLDLERRRVAAALATSAGDRAHLQFNHSGSRFAAVSATGCKIWETATGELYRDVEPSLLPTLGHNVSPKFANDDQLLLNNQYLLDLPSLIPIWQYTGAAGVVQAADAIWFVVDGNQGGVLFGAKLPQPGVQEALDRAVSDPNVFIVRPGTGLRLNLDQLPDAGEREAVRAALAKQLEAKELKVDPAAEVELVAWFDPPKEKNVIYHGFGGQQAVDFVETVGHIEIRWQGQVLWKASRSNEPFSVSRGRDESLQAAVKKYEKPPYDFLKGATLPRMLVRPGGQRGDSRFLGASQVTTTGIR